MNILRDYYQPDIVLSQREKIIPVIDLPANSTVIINGEGTMHSDAPAATKMLKYGASAVARGHTVELINSVWQRMSDEYVNIIKTFRNVEFREVLSLADAKVAGSIALDVSLHYDVPFEKKTTTSVCYGGIFGNGNPSLKIDWPYPTHRVDVFNSSWNDLVNEIRAADVIATGRHHEMYAALAARTPVLTIPGNTWKNEGFFYTVDAPELVLNPTRANIEDTLNGKYDQCWKRVWDYLDNYNYKYKIKK